MDLKVVLKLLGAPTVQHALESFLETNFSSSTEKLLVYELIKSIPLKGVLDEVQGICPLINVRIATPCGLSRCRYHVLFPYAGNCLLAYLDQQKSDRVPIADQSVLYGKPTKELNKIYKAAALKIQSQVFRDWAEQERLPIFEFFPTTAVCFVCESAEENPVILGDVVYCSEECANEVPVEQLRLEKLFGLDYASLKESLPKCFGQVAAEEILAFQF